MKDKIIDIFFLIFCALTVFLAFTLNTNYKLALLIVSGIFLGLYYGKNNYEIYHQNPFKEANRNLKLIAQIDSYWKHINSGVIGSVALYILADRINLFISHTRIIHLNSTDIILFLVVALTYTGLLPLTLTLIAAGGKVIENLLSKLK